MSQWNETSFSLHVENTKHEKYFFFNWLHFFFPWLFLYHKEVTRVFSSTLNFAWQFIGDAQFYRKLKYVNFVERNSILSRHEVLISLIILLQVMLSSWRSARKVQLCFLRDLAFHLQNCGINRNYMKCTQFGRLEGTRSSHKEFAYLLYNLTENTWNSQSLAS